MKKTLKHKKTQIILQGIIFCLFLQTTAQAAYIGGAIRTKGSDVGMGTSAPEARLHVVGNTTITGDLTVGGGVTIGGDLTISGDDLFMASNTAGALLVADGTNFNPLVMSGDCTIGADGVISCSGITASSVAYDDITAPDASSSIDFSTFTNTWTTSVAGGSTFFTINDLGGGGDLFRVNDGGSSDTTPAIFVDGNGLVGLGTTGSLAVLTVNEPDESIVKTDFTQSVTNAGIVIQTDFVNDSYTPGLFWTTGNNNPSNPKAGIFLYEDNNGIDIYFGTSNSYLIGITNNGLVISESGNLGIGTTAPTDALNVVGNVTMTGDLTIQGDDLFMASNTAGALLVADGTNFNPLVMSGDCTIGADGMISCGSIVAGSMEYSNLIDPTASTTIDFSTFTNTWTTSIASGGTFFTIDGAGASGGDIFRINDSGPLDTTPALFVSANGSIGIGTTALSATHGVTVANGGIQIALGSLDITGAGSISTAAGNISTIEGNISSSISNSGNIIGMKSTISGASGATSAKAFSAETFVSGLGISNAYGLYVNALSSAANGYGVYIEDMGSGAGDYSIYAASTKSYFGGDVGIGTTAPRKLLEVSGDATITGNLTIGGDDLFMASNTSGALLVADGTNFNPLVMSGDCTIGADGAIDCTMVSAETMPYSGLTDAQASTTIDFSTFTNTWTTSIASGGTFFTIDGPSSPAGDLFRINDSGVNDISPAIFVDANGSVGIGTTALSAKFSMVNTIAGDDLYISNRDIGADGVRLRLHHNSGTPANGDVVGAIDFDGEDANSNQTTFAQITAIANNVGNLIEEGSLTFSTVKSTTFSEAMRIDTDGNLGIGTTAPSSKLDITDYGTFSLFSLSRAEGSQGLETIVADGDIVGDLRARGYDGSAFLKVASMLIKVDGASGANLGGKFVFRTRPVGGSVTDRMTISGDGNIGIGTTVPETNLHVVGNASITGDLTIGGDDLFMASNTAGALLVADGTNFNPLVMSGDCTIGADGIIDCTMVAASSLAYDDLTAPDASTTIDFSTFTNTWTTSIASGGTFFTIDGPSSPAGDLFRINDSGPLDTTPALFVSANGSIGIGTTSLSAPLSVAGGVNTSGTTGGYQIDGNLVLQASSTNFSILVGQGAGAALLVNGSYNTVLGYEALTAVTTADYNTAVGYRAGYTNTSGGSYNSFFGERAGYFNTDGDGNSFIGSETGYFNTIGSNNTALGFYSLYNNLDGLGNTASGRQALTFNTTGDNNAAFGMQAGYLSTGDNNIFLGYQAGDNLTSGANNIILGYDIDAPSATASNQLNIGNLIFGTGIDGADATLSSGNIGIGIAVPETKLHVVGNATITGDLTIGGDDLFMASNTAGALLVADGTNFNPLVMSGDCTIGADGVIDCTMVSAETMPYSGLTDAQASTTIDFGLFTNVWTTDATSGDFFTIDDTGGGANLFRINDGDTGDTTPAIFVTGTGSVGFGTINPTSPVTAAERFQIPNSTAPTLSVDGEIAIETDADALNIQMGSGTAGQVPVNTDVALPIIQQKDVTLMEPDQIANVDDEVPIFTVDSYNFPNGIQVTAWKLTASDAASTDAIILEHWDGPLTGTAVKSTIDTITMNDEEQEAISPGGFTAADGAVAAGDYIIINLPATPANQNWLKITIWYYVKD